MTDDASYRKRKRRAMRAINNLNVGFSALTIAEHRASGPVKYKTGLQIPMPPIEPKK